MKTLNTYTPNELKDVARRNYHTIIQLLNEAGIKPIVQHQRGTRTYTYYGTDAHEFVSNIRAADDAKLADKLARKQAWAARREAALLKRMEKLAKKEEAARVKSIIDSGDKREQRRNLKFAETPIDVIREQLPQAEQMALDLRTIPDNGPSLRELVMETNRLLQEMLDFWKK